MLPVLVSELAIKNYLKVLEVNPGDKKGNYAASANFHVEKQRDGVINLHHS